jgi:hypothetical protein
VDCLRLILKIRDKRYNARLRGVDFDLTNEQVLLLLRNADISVDDWGTSKYHLARNGDSGDYVWGNCRFILFTANIAERKSSECQKQAARINVLAAHKKHRDRLANDPEYKDQLSEYGSRAPHKSLGRDELLEKWMLVEHLKPCKSGFATRAASVLGCSDVTIYSYKRLWRKLGIDLPVIRGKKS